VRLLLSGKRFEELDSAEVSCITTFVATAERWATAMAVPLAVATGTLLGILSLALLAASLEWAHHPGVRTDLLVSGWGLTAVGSLWLSVRSVRASHASLEVTPVLTKLGISIAALSLVALVLAGLAAAAGMDPAGGCGGG